MKAHILKSILTAVIFTCIEIAAVAQPSWTVSPNLYDYSMTVTGKIVIDGAVSVDQNDKIGAFIGGECRGVVNVMYQSTIKDYFVFLMIYSNTPTGSISFRVFDASENKEYDVSSTLSFSVNGIVGSVISPHEFSVVTKTYEAKILTFTIPDQEGSTRITSNTVALTQKITGDLSIIKPVFVLSEGAKAYVKNVLQVSGSTANDFQNPVDYKIVPQVGEAKYYRVTISKGSDTSTKIMLSNATVEENKDSVLVGELSAESDYLGSSYNFSLESIPESENQFFYLSEKGLFVKNAFNYEIKSEYQVNIQVANSSGISKQTLFTISVTDQNDPPTGISLSSGTIKESADENELVSRLIVSDEDHNDTHHFSFINGNEISGFDNSYFLIQGDSLLIKNKINKLGKELLKIGVKVTDKSGANFEKELSLQVIDINNAPQFISEPLSYAVQNQVYVYHIQVSDNEGDPLEIRFEGLPEWLKFNESTGLLSGTPYNEHVGDYQFNVVACDGVKECVQQVMISVINVNDPPEIQFYQETEYFYIDQENTFSLCGCITDPDVGDTLTFQLSTENNSAIPDWMRFDPLTLTISGNPPGDKRGIYNLKLMAADLGNLKEYLMFSIEVSFPTALDELPAMAGFRLFPNPVFNNLYIGVPEGEKANVCITNIAGQIVKTCQLSSGIVNEISVSEFKSGIYIIQLQQGENRTIGKLVKK